MCDDREVSPSPIYTPPTPTLHNDTTRGRQEVCRGVRSGVGSPQSGVGQQGAMGKVNLYTRTLDVRISGAGRCVYRWSGMGAGYRVYGAVCVRGVRS